MTIYAGSGADYWRYYGLQEDPFVASLEGKEPYLPASWEQYFDLLHYFCGTKNVLLTITGAQGIGKTTFVQQFLRQFSTEADIVRLTGAATLDSGQLCAMLDKEFDLPVVGGESLEERLEQSLNHFQYKPNLCLLVIDDAHLLPRKTLEILFYLVKQQSETQMRLHILLIGTTALKEKLAAFVEGEADQALIYSLSLATFNLEETGHYIRHRLVTAGLPANIPFTAKEIARIHYLAGGIPTRINSIARQMLVTKSYQRPRASLFSFITLSQRVLLTIVGGVFALLGISALVFIVVHSVKARAPQVVKPVVSSAAPLPQAQPTPESAQAPELIPAPEPMPATLLAPSPPEPVTAPAETPTAATLDKAQQAITRTQENNNSNNYTVQLMSLSNEAALKKFIAAHAGDDNYFYYYDKTKKRYILLYGQYETSAQASIALRSLPAELRNLHPWVRPIP